MLDLKTGVSQESFRTANPGVLAWVRTLDRPSPVMLFTPSPAARIVVRIAPDQPAAAAPLAVLPTSFDAEGLRLVALIQARSEPAMRAFHARFERKVFACAMAIVRRDEIADEVVSATFMQAWSTAATYAAGRGSVTSWLLSMARSRALDAMRRARVLESREVSVDDDATPQEFAGDGALEPLAHLERSRDQWRLQRALARLTPVQRQVLSLTSIDGLSHDEASQHLSLPLGTVKSHARRGMAALRTRCESIDLTPH